MKKVLLTMLAAGLTAVFAAGCVHFEYEGESAPATGNAVSLVRKGKGACPAKCTAKRLGNAVVWGNYQDVSRDDLEERLLREAEDRGADTVLITADQVVPSGTVVQVDPMLRTMEAVSPNNTYSMNQLQQDFDGGYGQAELFGKNVGNSLIMIYSALSDSSKPCAVANTDQVNFLCDIKTVRNLFIIFICVCKIC